MQKILCIEDEKGIREDLVEFLEDEGYKVSQAADGVDGLEAILSDTPDLVLCDINMPRKNGFDVLADLRGEHPEHASIPFIFLTANSERDHVKAGLDSGADDYLTKPVDFEMLLVKVRAALVQMERLAEQHAIETEKARLRTLQATMATVHDVMNNFLQNLMLFRLEAANKEALSDDSLQIFDDLVEDTASKLKTISDLKSVVEKNTDSGIVTLKTTTGR